MGEYVSPFGSKGNSGGGQRSTNYISPFEGSVYTEDYWKKKQQQDQAKQQQDEQKRKVQENLDKTSADVEKSKQEIASPKNILGDILGAANNFTSAVNEKVLGGATKAAVKAYNTVTTGFNQDEANKRTDEFLKKTGQTNDKGEAPLASGAEVNREGDVFKIGEAAGGLVKGLTVDLPVEAYKSGRNLVNQARISSEMGNGAGLDQSNADKLKKFIDEDEKAGKLTKAQADEKRNKLQAEVEKTNEAIKRGEAKTGTMYDQSSGAISLLETAGNLAGVAGGATKIGEKIAESGITQDVGKAVGKTFNALRADSLKGFSKEVQPTDSLMPEIGQEQFKGTFLDPQKVDVKPSGEAVDIGVTTPVKPGVKDISSTSSVEVRTPKIMSDAEYKTKFKKISNSYDQAQKKLKSLPPIKQNIVSKIVEDTHTKALEDLNDAFYNPRLPDGTSKVKTLSKTTTKAEPTTGGTPKGFVNTTGKMNEMENAIFTAAKDKAEKRLGRSLNQQETAGVFDRTKQIAEEKGFSSKVPLDEKPTSPEATVVSGTEVNPPVEAPKPTPAPVVDGTDKVSGNAARIESVAVEKKLTEKMGDLPQYKAVNMKEQANQAVKLINTDKQKAIDIIEGKANPEGNLKAQSVHQALEDLAVREGDGELLTKLAKSHINTELSEGAQKLRIAAERDPHSPVEAIRQVRDARLKAAQSRAKTTVAKEKQAIQSKVDAATPKVKKETWDSFVKGLEC